MTYQVVGTPRTGTTLLNHFSIHHNNNIGFNEFLSDYSRSELQKDFQSYTIADKFKYLKMNKEKDVHFSIKIFPYRLVSEGWEKDLLDYLKDYKILTIDRDPFDACISFCYQIHSKWKHSHRRDYKFGIVDPFNIESRIIKAYVEMYKFDKFFLDDMCGTYKCFNYEDLTIQNLQMFFDSDYIPSTQPINIDYQQYILNLKEVKETFYNEMHRA